MYSQFIQLAPRFRQKFQPKSKSILPSKVSGITKASDDKFQCPAECNECCRLGTMLHFSYDKTKFKCIMSAEKAEHFHIAGRHCTKAKLRDSDNNQAKAQCE